MKYYKIDETESLIDVTDQFSGTSPLRHLFRYYDVVEYEKGVFCGFSLITGQVEGIVISTRSSLTHDDLKAIIKRATDDRSTEISDHFEE